MLIFSGIYKNAKKHKSKICMIAEYKKFTYEDLTKQIDKKSSFLSHRFKKGSKIIIKNIQPINTIVNILSCSKAGLISIPVNPKILNKSLNSIKETIKPCSIIQDDFIYDYKQHEKILFKDIDKQYLCYNFINNKINDKNIFLGALSSGTTGKSKIIWRDHTSWTSAFKHQSDLFNISNKDILFLVGSLSYTANLNSAMHILNEGGTIVFSKSIYPKTWIKEIEDNKVSSIFMVPAHYRLLLKELNTTTMCNINSLLSAGAKIDTGTVTSLKEKFPKAHICEYYGASELGHISYINFRENFNENSVGKAFPLVKLWLEPELLKNNKGLIWVQSPYICPKFRPKATVGDIGKIDKEGNLYILGRENEIINKGGVKILPYDVETVLNKHPKILESIVFPIKNYSKGEIVASVIIAKDSCLTIKEVMNYCSKHLDIHKRPQQIKIVTNVKLNSNGKIDRAQLIKSISD